MVLVLETLEDGVRRDEGRRVRQHF